MIEARADLAATPFVLPPDAKVLSVSELAPRLRARIGPVEDGHSVVTRPGFRVAARLVPGPLAALISEFRTPSLLTEAIHRFARSQDQDPLALLELAFDALATLITARVLVPHGAPDAAAPVPSLGAGQAFAGFEIEALVRSLEDSEVYRARRGARTAVALKVARDDRRLIADVLANEARALRRLGRGDVPALLDHGTEGGRVYLALEWCDGVSIAVAAQQARAARDRRRLHAVVGRMLEVYGRLHAKGVLHGDVHPGNCLLRDDGRVVVLDFGGARLVEDAAADVDPARVGIPQFHDPQIARALLAGAVPPAATPASEQWAVAALAYLLVTGLHPIDAPGIHEELLRRIAERAPLPFAARGVAAWPEVEAVLARGMAKEPGERFRSVAALARAFRSAALPPARRVRPPAAVRRVFRAAVASARTLARRSTSPVDDAWFALRAALATGDGELLLAAEILARGAGPGWGAQTVTAHVARARSDRAMEETAIRAFLADAARLPPGPGSAAAVLAAAGVLQGAQARTGDTAALAAWASQRLDRPAAGPWSDGVDGRVPAAWATLALALARAGVTAPHAELEARLEALRRQEAGGVWLWALAHDVFGRDDDRARALAATLPSAPLARAFAMLRLHQLTGEGRWVARATRALARAPDAGLPADEAALLVAELMAPERAIVPPALLASIVGVGSAGAHPDRGR